MRTPRDLAQRFPASAEKGLTAEQVIQSRQQFGSNRLTPLAREPAWEKFLERFDEPIIKILLAAAYLSILVDLISTAGDRAANTAGLIAVAGLIIIFFAAYALKRPHWLPRLLFLATLLLSAGGAATGHVPLDSLAIIAAVILATGVAFASEFKSDREFEVLNAQRKSQQAKVFRGGEFHTVPLEDVVVGDAVILEAGDEIPADGWVVKATDLHVNESLMTGEPEPVHEQPFFSEETADRPEEAGRLFRGTQVVEGMGEMLVTEVGDATYLGKMARQLSAGFVEADDRPMAEGAEHRLKHKLTIAKEFTPLQQKLKRLADQISKVGYLAAVGIFLALLIQGVLRGELGWTNPGPAKSAAQLLSYFMYMVIIIVVAVPEGLPMSVTISLALAMRKMTRANSLVRQLVACETIGSTTVICTDKTGTLTQNQMQVVRLCWDGQAFDRETPEWVHFGPDSFRVRSLDMAVKPLDWLVLNAAVNSTANLEEKEGKLLPVGNSTEGALLLWLHEAGVDYRKLRLEYDLLSRAHFSSERKRMTSLIRLGEALVMLVKGAPEWIVGQSRHYLAGDGSVHPWTSEARAKLEESLRETTRRSMRTLAFGYAVLPGNTPGADETLHAELELMPGNLVYAGFVAIRDPLRSDVKDAIKQCRQAGIEVKMITGDSAETARSISTEIDLLDHPDALVLTSQEFAALTDVQAKDAMPHLRVLARAQPLDKFRMVKLLQEQNEVVAVTGDGTNDAPALKRADVGLAMGRTGTEVAKEASKIVLLDDAFSTIVKAVHWGRALYENIQRFVQFQLTINTSALAIVFLAPFFGVKPPFTILQLLWINVIMDTLASIALCSEPPRPGLMRLPPKRRDENLITRSMLWNILTTAGFFVVVMMALLLGMYYGKWFAGPGQESAESPGFTIRQGSIFFTVYIFFQIWNEINCRSLVPEVSGLRGILRNRVFLGIVAVIVLLHVLILSFGGSIFHVEPLGPLAWLAIAGSTASVLVFAECVRHIQLAKNRTRASDAVAV